MNTNSKIILAALPGVIALAVLMLSLSYGLNADALIGFVSVLALVAIAAIEYRVDWKRLLGR